MPRPRQHRRVSALPASDYYKPRGVPLSTLECVNLTVDELEAIRLSDLEGMYQEQAAEQMQVSRQTLGRILESAHRKIADALVHGKALSIEGGPVSLDLTPPPPTRGSGCGGGGRRRRHRGGR